MKASNKFMLKLAVVLAGISPTLATAGGENGFYIGAGLGQASLEASTSDPTGGANFNFDGDDAGFKLILGYNFGIMPLVDLAIEGSFVDFGKLDGSSSGREANFEVSAFDGFGLVGINLGPVGVFGKGGFVTWDNDATLAGTASNDSGTSAAYGVGARVQLLSVTLRGEYELFDIDGANDLALISASVLYTF